MLELALGRQTAEQPVTKQATNYWAGEENNNETRGFIQICKCKMNIDLIEQGDKIEFTEEAGAKAGAKATNKDGQLYLPFVIMIFHLSALRQNLVPETAAAARFVFGS